MIMNLMRRITHWIFRRGAIFCAQMPDLTAMPHLRPEAQNFGLGRKILRPYGMG